MNPLVQLILQCVFWFTTGGVLYTYAVYPVLIYLFSRWFGRTTNMPMLGDDALPKLSVLIAAHDEQSVIGERIKNALAMDYPREKLEIVIASDGSTDDTALITRKFAGQGVRLLDYSRRGKAAVLNSAMGKVTGEIVLLSDANTHTDPDAARKLVRWFADPQVGAVSGRLVLTDPKCGKNADGIYWKYETFLKKNESRLGALLGCNGAVYAMRSELFSNIPGNTIVDDFVIPLSARLKHGCRIIYDPQAVAHEETSPDIRSEFKRRARIGAGGWQAIVLLWQLLDPRQSWVAYTFFSHKVLRWLCPFLMLAAFITNLLLCSSTPYNALMVAQVTLYCLALAGWLVPGTSPAARIARVASMFVMMNLALLVGFLKWLDEPPSGQWARTRRLADGSFGPALQPVNLQNNIVRTFGIRDAIIILAMVTAAVVIMFDAWRDIYRVANVDEELGYVLLAPLVIGWLALNRRKQLKNCRMRPEWFGLPILLFGAAVYWWGFHFDPSAWRAGAVLIAVGAFMIAAGRDVCTRFAPAIVAAVFLIPIDPNGRYHLAGPLQERTAQATQIVCDLLGMNVDRAGNMLSINGLDVAVAEACNGMRMVLTLFLVCYVASFTLTSKSSVRILLLGLSPFVAIASNVVRLVPTLWMFGHTSISSAEQFHALSGWAMTFIAFFILTGLARLLGMVARALDTIELTPVDSDSAAGGVLVGA